MYNMDDMSAKDFREILPLIKPTDPCRFVETCMLYFHRQNVLSDNCDYENNDHTIILQEIQHNHLCISIYAVVQAPPTRNV